MALLTNTPTTSATAGAKPQQGASPADPSGFAALLQLATTAPTTTVNGAQDPGTQSGAQRSQGGGRHRAPEEPLAGTGHAAAAIAVDPAALLAAAPLPAPVVTSDPAPPSEEMHVAAAIATTSTPAIAAPAPGPAVTASSAVPSPAMAITPAEQTPATVAAAVQPVRAPAPTAVQERVDAEPSTTPGAATSSSADIRPAPMPGRHAAVESTQPRQPSAPASAEPSTSLQVMPATDSTGRHSADAGADDNPHAPDSAAAAAAVRSDATAPEFALATAAPSPASAPAAPTAPTAPAQSPQTAPARTDYPVEQPALGAAVGALRSRSDGSHELTVALHPADLGAVRVHARLHEGTLDVTVSCADDAARAAVTAALPALHQQLSELGAGTIAIAADSQHQQPEREHSPAGDQQLGRHQTPAEDNQPQQNPRSRHARRDPRSELDQWM
jgi:flagellar hook-length control protein FliK